MRITYNNLQKKYLIYKFIEYSIIKYFLPLSISIVLTSMFLNIFFRDIVFNLSQNLPIFSIKSIILLPLLTFLFISIGYLFSIIIIGIKRILTDVFIVERLNVKQIIKNEFILSNNHYYKITGIENRQRISNESQCDLISITNNYGFILWEIVIPTPYKTDSVLEKVKLEYLDITKLKN